MVTRVSGARGDPNPVDAKTMPDRRRPQKRKRPRPKGPRALEMLWVRGSGHQVEGSRFALFLQPWRSFEMLKGRSAVRVAWNRLMPAFTPLAFAEGILRTQVSRFDSVDHGITSLFAALAILADCCKGRQLRPGAGYGLCFSTYVGICLQILELKRVAEVLLQLPAQRADLSDPGPSSPRNSRAGSRDRGR